MGDLTCVKFYLNKVPNKNIRDALFGAAHGGQKEILDYIMNNYETETWSCILNFAVPDQHNNYEFLDYIVSKGGDLTPALKTVIFLNKPDTVKYLLNKGADVKFGKKYMYELFTYHNYSHNNYREMKAVLSY